MTKIDIFSGFLGAGKTTLIKKLIQESFGGQKVVLIENEFGEIGIDGGFLQESGIQINELNAGCICCSLVGDFREALKKVVAEYHPDRILIEPSGEFYDDQISHASCILLSRTQTASEDKVAAAVALLREKNPTATIVTTPWEQLTGAQILSAMSQKHDFVAELLALAAQANAEHHHHDEEEHDHEGHCCHHHHDEEEHDHEGHCCHHHHDEEEHDHEGHCCHHHHDEEEHDHEGHCCHHHHEEEEHHHHYDENGVCSCGHHHHDHDADEVFTSWGVETARKFSKADIEAALTELDSGKYGMILRSKGIVDGGAEGWLEFDYVPGEWEVRSRGADVGGKLVVIGSKMDEKAIAALFGC